MGRDDRGMSGNDWTRTHETDPAERRSDFQRDHGYRGCLRMHDVEATLDQLSTARLTIHVTCAKCGDWTAVVQTDGDQSWFMQGHK